MNIIITGASRGIGYEVVRLLSKDSENRIIAISRNIKGLKKLQNNCNIENPENKLITLPYDLENLLENEINLINHIKETFPDKKIDILINNAGLLINKPFEDFSLHEIQKIFNINLIVPSLIIKHLIDFFNRDKGAHIINISSMGGFQGSSKFKGLSFYSSSKAALANLTECLAEEYKDTNIYFNCLALGSVETEMLKEAFPGYKASLTASQMAIFIVDFALNGNKYFNGKIIPVALSTP